MRRGKAHILSLLRKCCELFADISRHRAQSALFGSSKGLPHSEQTPCFLRCLRLYRLLWASIIYSPSCRDIRSCNHKGVSCTVPAMLFQHPPKNERRFYVRCSKYADFHTYPWILVQALWEKHLWWLIFLSVLPTLSLVQRYHAAYSKRHTNVDVLL